MTPRTIRQSRVLQRSLPACCLFQLAWWFRCPELHVVTCRVTFSTAVRSRQHLCFFQTFNVKDQVFVNLHNLLLRRVARRVRMSLVCGHTTSPLWHTKQVKKLLCFGARNITFDFCQYGRAFPRRTPLLMWRLALLASNSCNAMAGGPGFIANTLVGLECIMVSCARQLLVRKGAT